MEVSSACTEKTIMASDISLFTFVHFKKFKIHLNCFLGCPFLDFYDAWSGGLLHFSPRIVYRRSFVSDNE